MQVLNTDNAVSMGMAAAINSFNLGYGFKQLHPSYLIRCYHVNSHTRPWQFCSTSQKLLFTVHKRHLPLKKKTQFGQVLSALSNNDADKYHEEEDVSRVTLIWRAVKLPIYSVAFIPLTVGCAAAYLQTGIFVARRYFVLLASSVLIITWLNLSNDVYDFDTGADKNKKESVVNMVGSRSGTLVAAYSLLALGFTGLAWASSAASSVQALLLLACAIFCGYIYQCPPFRLSYQGLGEPLCFYAFGPFATTAFYLLLGSASEVIDLPLTGAILSASVLVGFTTSLILLCSHFHQIEEDKAVGKISPLVRLGTEGGSHVVKVAITTLYSILLVFGLSKTLPLTCILLCALTLPMGKLVVDYVEENHKNKAKIFMAKYYCVRLHALFGTALAGGLVSARLLTGS